MSDLKLSEGILKPINLRYFELNDPIVYLHVEPISAKKDILNQSFKKIPLKKISLKIDKKIDRNFTRGRQFV
jgi:hypothetical protein